MIFNRFVLTSFKKSSKQLNIIRVTLAVIVKGLWLNSEQTTEEELIIKLSMELRVQILPGLEAKRYKSLRRIIANAGDFTG